MLEASKLKSLDDGEIFFEKVERSGSYYSVFLRHSPPGGKEARLYFTVDFAPGKKTITLNGNACDDERQVRKLSEAARTIKAAIESDPLLRLRFSTGKLRVEYGRFILGDFTPESASLSEGAAISAFAKARLLEPPKSLSRLSHLEEKVVLIGSEGFRLSEALQRAGVASRRKIGKGCYMLSVNFSLFPNAPDTASQKNEINRFLQKEFALAGFPAYLTSRSHFSDPASSKFAESALSAVFAVFFAPVLFAIILWKLRKGSL